MPTLSGVRFGRNVSGTALLVAAFGMMSTLCADSAEAGNGVDDLRGRWDVWISQSEAASYGPLRFYINDLTFDADETDQSLAAGCMESEGGMAPLSMLATAAEKGRYDVTIVSTIVPGTGDPVPARFVGHVETFGRGVTDDLAGGDGPEFGGGTSAGTWQASHHDRRRRRCPAVEIPPLSMWGDVTVHVVYPGGIAATLYEVQTDVPASAALVTRPDGSSLIIKPVVDSLKSPEFSAKFAFQTPFQDADPGYPTPYLPYRFSLLDAVGKPIAGATAEDTWTECTISPPANISATVIPGTEPKLFVTWDSVSEPPGADTFGMYELTVAHYPPGFGPVYFDAAFMVQSRHTIPWNFESGAQGSPDGNDFGVGLGQLPSDQTYALRVDAFAVPSAPPNRGWECHVVDFDENVLLRKEADGSIVVLGMP